MREFSVREMRAGYGAIATALETDGEVVLTHHGKPFARVVPFVAVPDAAAVEAERLRRREAWGEERRKALAKMPVLPPFDWDAFRADR
jgi:antitoxin (DNA-binding transcriptional repressor) of toxin-antitoxin stability system